MGLRCSKLYIYLISFTVLKIKDKSRKKKKKGTITIIKKGAVNREVSGHNSILPLHEDRFLQPQK